MILDQCHTLEIVITANTDVGSTTSNIFHGGFPKVHINYILLYYNLLFQ